MKKRFLSLLMLVGVAVPLLASCGANPSEDPSSSKVAEPLTVVDAAGRTVTFEKPVQKAICLGAGALRLYSYVGDMSKLIAVERSEKAVDNKQMRPYAYAYKDVLKDLPEAAQGYKGMPEYNGETLVALKPDVIFTYDTDTADIIDGHQKQLNIPLVALNYGKANAFDINVEGNMFLKSAKLVADIMGTKDKYDAFHAYLSEKVADLQNRTKDIPEAERKTVYFGGVGRKKAIGLHCSDVNNAILKVLNINNAAASIAADKISNYQEINDKEALVSLNPEMVFIDYAGLKTCEEQFAKPGEKYDFTNWDALKNGKTYVCLPYRDKNFQTECGLIDAYFVGKTVYPEQFKDVNLDTVAKDIFQHIYGKDCYTSYMSDNGLTDVCLKSKIFA